MRFIENSQLLIISQVLIIIYTFASKLRLIKGMTVIINRDMRPTILLSLIPDGYSTRPVPKDY